MKFLGFEDDISEIPSSPTKNALKIDNNCSTDDGKILALSPGQDPFDVDSLQEFWSTIINIFYF